MIQVATLQRATIPVVMNSLKASQQCMFLGIQTFTSPMMGEI